MKQNIMRTWQVFSRFAWQKNCIIMFLKKWKLQRQQYFRMCLYYMKTIVYRAILLYGIIWIQNYIHIIWPLVRPSAVISLFSSHLMILCLVFFAWRYLVHTTPPPWVIKVRTDLLSWQNVGLPTFSYIIKLTLRSTCFINLISSV